MDPSPLDSGWDGWTKRLLWTAGCFCAGGRPAGRGGVWAAGGGACTRTVFRRPAEEGQTGETVFVYNRTGLNVPVVQRVSSPAEGRSCLSRRR